jgi:hypothetical protein
MRNPLRVILVSLIVSLAREATADEGLLAHWPLASDFQDHTGHGHNPAVHAVDFAAGSDGQDQGARFDGREGRLEISSSDSLRLGTGDFTVAGWIYTAEKLDDNLGDIASKFDPATRTGFNFGIMNYAGVTSNQPNFRHLQFGIDAGGTGGQWTDCGRPGNAVLIYGLAVFDGALYAGTCEAGAAESGHLYRYEGGADWTDLGSPHRSNAVSALAVHAGRLYAGVSRYRLRGSSLAESENPHLGGKVYRYEGDQTWTDCGQLPGVEAINGLVVYRGSLYASSTYAPAGLFRYEGDTTWTDCGSPEGKRVEALTVHDGHLYATGYDEGAVYRYDGRSWEHCGLLGDNTQTYSFAMYQGRMHVGTWRSGKVFEQAGDGSWADAGRLGEELEVMGMAVYNGQLYAGTLPLAQVYRYAGDARWVLSGRLDHTPDVNYRRAWTMAVHQGRLFCGTLPSGHVYSLKAGECVTLDKELPAGWCHVAAVKDGGRLKLFVNSRLAAESDAFDPKQYDLTNDRPLTIGFGQHDFFHGRMRDVRLYSRALSAADLANWTGP